ncbi:MAG: molybdopterin molybdotransferase MoeA [Steroidobacteraceae bacterium]
MISPAEADGLIGQHLNCLPIESLPLTQCAGAILRENVYGERDQPPFDRVAMDGIAIDSAAVRQGARRLHVQALQAAGDPPLTLANGQHCIEIMTGAMLPTGCDAVVPVEQIRTAEGFATLGDDAAPEPYANVHRRGSDSRQGALLLAAGGRLGAPEIAVAAGAGMARIRVSAQPTIIVVSTGNELVEPGEPIEPHQIRRSNAYGIVTALRQRSFLRVADDHVVDDAEALRRRLRVHLDTHDILILSGGVSMGRLDLVPQVLQSLGVREVFHKISQRPGKPMWFGIGPTGTAVFALPGNPVSTLVCLSRYVFPALYAAMGLAPAVEERLALAAAVEVRPALTYFMPVRIRADDWGRAWAHPAPTNGSGDFTSLAGTDGFVELPPGPNTYAKGFVTRVYRW